jgi:tetratricopeptide (TPR) repeat protein
MAGDFTLAIKDASLALDLDPHNAVAYAVRGASKAQLGLVKDALSDLDQAIRLDAHYSFALATRGSAYLAIGQIGKAIDDIVTAVSIDPSLVTLKEQLKEAVQRAALVP